MSIFRRTFMFKITGSRPKVAPGSDHDVAQLNHVRNICTQFELLPVYGHRDLARTKSYVIFRRIFMFKVTGPRSKVEPRSDHDVAQLDHGRNMCAKFELPPAYGHRDLAWAAVASHPPDRPHAHPCARPPVQDENNTRTAMNGWGVKMKVSTNWRRSLSICET